MSVSPSFPPGGPSLAEVLIERTFARPPRPFVDGDFIAALTEADDAVAARSSQVPADGAGPQVDVRA
jgi:hypothetical protein